MNKLGIRLSKKQDTPYLHIGLFMKNEDFRYILRGKQCAYLTKDEQYLLNPVNQRGEGREHALLLLHGFSSSPAVYRYLIPQIKKYDAIVCPVLKGHAESIELFSHSKAADWRSSAHDACKTLINEYKKVDILGLSLGGLLACELSHCYTINHLFLLAPALKLHMHVRMMLWLAKGLRYLGFSQLRNKAGSLITNDRAEITYKKLPISTIIEMLSLVQEYQWSAPSCAVDLFLGTQDDVVASSKVEALFAPLPNATIHWLKNSAHVLPLDNDLSSIVHIINHPSSALSGGG